MKYEEYIKKLDNLNDEFEEGFLIELQEKPPTNLHGEIMKSVNKERKRVNFFNYRIYAPAVAAVLIFSIIINKPEILEKISFIKSAKLNSEQSVRTKETNDSKTTLINGNSSGKLAINVPDNTINEEPKNNEKDNSSGKNIAKQNKTAPDDKTDTTPQQKKAPDTKVAAADNPKEKDAPSNKDNTDVEIGGKEGMDFNISNLWGMAFYKEPEINYEIVLDENKTTVLNFITENYMEKLSTSNTYKLSLEQFENLDKLLNKYNINKKTLNGTEINDNVVVKINLVNYRIVINKNAPEVIKFLEGQAKCIKIDEATYKILAEDINELDKMLSSAGIKKDFICEAEGKYVFFKASIINYETCIDASLNSIASFIKNTDNCKPLGDNVYRMNRETFNKFKELLINSNFELKAINETNNQDILIKINNI